VKTQSKYKILFIVPLPPPIHGAALRNESLVKSKLLNTHFIIQIIPLRFVDNIENIGKFSFKKITKSIIVLLQILKKLILEKYDLIYFNIALYGFALYRDAIFLFVLKIFRKKVLLHLRTQGVKKQTDKSWVKKKFFTLLFKNTEVICISNHLYEDIKDVYPKRPFIVNNGIEIININKEINNNPEPVILFFSNLSQKKGVLDLIEALRILKENKIKFKANIVGPEYEIKITFLQQLINQYNLNECVAVRGGKYAEEKLKCFREADIFVFPTHFEAFPGVLLEAMQFELPTIATNEGGIPEIIDHGFTGYLVEKNNINELSKKLEMLITNPELRKEMGKNGRNKFLENYTLDIFEANMKTTFDRVIKYQSL
jgi:glycosyltransferase involved in cell wall biosynthesis